MYENECDVFIAGSGISGLYAAILLSKIGLSVHITDSQNTRQTTTTNDLLLFSPRSLQLLSQLDLLTAITQKGCGIRHWTFDLYHNKGYGSQALTVEKQSIRLWENETSEYNYSLSCPKSIVIDILTEYLEKEEGIQIDGVQELIEIEEKQQQSNKRSSSTNNLSSADLALYYQYRPLPPISSVDDEKENNSSTRRRAIKSIHLKHKETNQVVIWKSQAVIGADGDGVSQTSFIRQKLGIALKSYNTNSETRIFYTLQINIVSTNYPSVRQISTVCKNKDIIYIIGHQTRLYITFEHKPNWTKLSIDDEISVNIAIRHIKAMMDPFQIEFGKVISYTRWHGNNISSSCEEHNLDSSLYFLVGNAAQTMTPPGLFDTNANLEQVQNLCWKLALSLQHSASPNLLETFESENKLKIEESMQVSSLFINLIGDYHKQTEAQSSLNASHIRDCVYQLRRFKNCFVGTTPLTANILNSQTEEEIGDNMTINSSTPSFVFVAPPTPPIATKTSGSLLNNTLGVLNLATAGYLAPNAKLKPYTLFQLLLLSSSQQSTQQKPVLTTTLSSQQLNTVSISNSKEHSVVKNINNNKKFSPPSTLVISTKNLNNNGKTTRQRSNSVTSSSTNIWSVLPIFQKSSQFMMKRTSLISTVTPSSRNSISASSSSSSSDNTTTIAATTVTSPTTPTTTTTASALISAERWKSIKPNHLQLLDRIQSFNKNGCTFTILIFCGSISETKEKTSTFIKFLMSPTSFLYRFERATTTRDHNQNSMISIGSHTTTSAADRRLSVLSASSVNNNGGRRSFDQQQRRDSNDSTSLFTAADPTRFSMSTMSSSCTFNSHLLAQQQGSLFSILFISNSNKNEAAKYLNNTPPATVHSTFPNGLAQVFLDHDGQCYKAYNINKKQEAEVVVVRPDGYIGTRVSILSGREEESFDRLSYYFDAFLRPPVDMNSAAAVVAAGYE